MPHTCLFHSHRSRAQRHAVSCQQPQLLNCQMGYTLRDQLCGHLVSCTYTKQDSRRRGGFRITVRHYFGPLRSMQCPQHRHQLTRCRRCHGQLHTGTRWHGCVTAFQLRCSPVYVLSFTCKTRQASSLVAVPNSCMPILAC